MKRPLNLPNFKNEEEVEKFMENTDFSKYLEPSDLKKISFPNLKLSKRLISLRVEQALFD